MIRATRKVVLMTRIPAAGKVKEIGRKIGVKHMRERGSLHFLL
jgi:hypothetical protein